MSENNSCLDVKDLSKTWAKKIESTEELVNRSIDNCSLNKHEWREILKRLRKDKDALSEETKARLLDIAEKGSWTWIVSILKHKNKDAKDEWINLKLSETLSETKETKETKNNLEYIIKSLESELNEVKDSKKWNSLSFWNKDDKKIKLEILNNILSILVNLKSNFSLSSKDIKSAISTELSTDEWWVIYKKIRMEVMNILLLTYFSWDNFIPDLKQKSVKQIRENLWSKELKDLFKLEMWQDYVKWMTVSEDKKWLLEAYENWFDTKDEWGTFSDENWDKAKWVAAYDLPSMIVTWWVTWVALKWVVWVGRWLKAAKKVSDVSKWINNSRNIAETSTQVVSTPKTIPKAVVEKPIIKPEAVVKPTVKPELAQKIEVKPTVKPEVKAEVKPNNTIVSEWLNWNYLVSLFESVTPQVWRWLNKTIFLRNWAKWNVQMFFKRVAWKDQIDRVTVLINWETTAIKFVWDKAIQTVGKQDMTQNVTQLVNKYKDIL